MRVVDMNWMQLEAAAKADDRAVLPIGSIEQHAYLSLGVDAILAERVAVEAAEPVGTPVYPTLSYGLTPNFVDYPGTVTLKLSTLIAVMKDVLDGISRAGFKRIVIVNGHGGNDPAKGAVLEWLDAKRGHQVKWHNWWNAPRTWATVQRIDPIASHASWMENFPWTRLGNVAMPETRKPMVDVARLPQLDPGEKRRVLGDGNFGGFYKRDDAEMMELWQTGVAEAREAILGGWN
jgi:creatinine amidohydrolase